MMSSNWNRNIKPKRVDERSFPAKAEVKDKLSRGWNPSTEVSP